MDILSTLKTEYSRTIILVIIPGSIAIFPYAQILCAHWNIQLNDSNNYWLYGAFTYLFASIFMGFLLQDLGARLEMALDWLYCKVNNISYPTYNSIFELYLFNKRQENYIVTHYYRSLLVRTKFELHSIGAIILLWLGLCVKYSFEKFYIDYSKTTAFVSISGSVLVYLAYEAYKGVGTLHSFRQQINRKFGPQF
jgi:hypothetical protein